ncbi:MAG: NADH-quinone oxidoreductase subunit C [Candidatus Ratteibacteria bacterium]|jgi:Ni,Fe-hydrogenase III component G
MKEKKLFIDSIKKSFGRNFLIEKESSGRWYISLKKGQLREVVSFLLKEKGFRFSTASAVDLLHAFEILYHFSADREGIFLSLRLSLKRERPSIPSLSNLLPCALFIEREMRELMGIFFEGHPDKKNLLLPDDWPKGNYPLRKP